MGAYRYSVFEKRNLPVPENYVTEICARSFEEAAQYTIDLLGLQETVEGIIEEWNNMAVEEYSNPVSYTHLQEVSYHKRGLER